MNPVPSPLMQSLIELSIRAGAEIMAIYATDFSAKAKGDLTPVTEADEAAEKIILAGLAKIDGSVPVISEEAASAGRIPEVSRRFFLVDPLDGTKEFLARNGEFTVNIAWVQAGRPLAGVVHAPADAVRPAGDHGRFAVTKSQGDDYVFRAAPLRNVAVTAPFFHSGNVWKLQEAVTIMGDAQLGATLTPEEAEKIHLFLHALTAPIPKIDYPELPERDDATPKPSGV